MGLQTAPSPPPTTPPPPTKKQFCAQSSHNPEPRVHDWGKFPHKHNISWSCVVIETLLKCQTQISVWEAGGLGPACYDTAVKSIGKKKDWPEAC